MALAGQGVLAIWNGIAPEAERDFVAWHVREHIPERVGVPGFLRARRYVALSGHPKYFNFYETETAATLTAPGYLERLNAPSDWTKRVVQHFKDTSRTICSVAASEGLGDGAMIGTLRLEAAADTRDVAASARAALFGPMLDEPGIVGVHLLEGQADPGGQTAEKALRDRPDRTEGWILLVEATDAEPIRRAVTRCASPAGLSELGLQAQPDGLSIYRLEYALSRDQLR